MSKTHSSAAKRCLQNGFWLADKFKQKVIHLKKKKKKTLFYAHYHTKYFLNTWIGAIKRHQRGDNNM